MSRLRTVNASQAATDQRRGRAGRQGPGICIRLWPESEQQRRRPDEPPEILTSDLTTLALQIAAWGATDAAEIPWLDPPPEAALAAGRGVLAALGALDDSRRLTTHGRAMAEFGVEPRLAHLMLRGAELGAAATACDLATVLSDRDLLTGRDRPVDLRLRLEALVVGGHGIDAGRRARAPKPPAAGGAVFDADDDPVDLDLLCSASSFHSPFPERIAQRRSAAGSFLLASGAGASTSHADGLAREPYLAVAETDGIGADARIVTAAPLDRDDIDMFHAERIEQVIRGEWDRHVHDVVFERQERIGALALRREPDDDPDHAALNEALLAGVRREGVGLLRWSASTIAGGNDSRPCIATIPRAGRRSTTGPDQHAR